MPDPDPELADRLEEARALSMLCGATGTAISHADAKAAAVRLRKLDRIEATLGDVWTADEIRWAVGDGRVVKMAYYPLGGYAEDHDGHYWRLAPTGTGHRARSRACADPNCLWLVVIMFDPSSATWTLLHECDGDRTVTSSGHTTWQEASRHAFKLDVPHREVCG
jgi:hypothetical protein